MNSEYNVFNYFVWSILYCFTSWDRNDVTLSLRKCVRYFRYWKYLIYGFYRTIGKVLNYIEYRLFDILVNNEPIT